MAKLEVYYTNSDRTVLINTFDADCGQYWDATFKRLVSREEIERGYTRAGDGYSFVEVN